MIANVHPTDTKATKLKQLATDYAESTHVYQ